MDERYLLKAEDFVAELDADGNEVGQVPSHWTPMMLAPGHTMAVPAPGAPGHTMAVPAPAAPVRRKPGPKAKAAIDELI